jgi:type IV secretion system protein VirD4
MYFLCRILLILALFVGYVAAMLVLFQFGGLILIGLAVMFVVAMTRRRYGPLTAFGTARWADANDLKEAGMLGGGRGLILGRVMVTGKPPFSKSQRELFSPSVPSKPACEQFIDSLRLGQKPKLHPAFVRLAPAVHTAVFAPTGVGKNVSCVFPFLLATDESAVVVDFKGENYLATAEHRRRRFGHKIVCLDPFMMVTKHPDTFNPLDVISKDSPWAIDEARSLAEALVVRTGQEHDRHWIDSAEAWISSQLSLVIRYGEPDDRSLQTVRTLLTSPEKLDMAIKLMCVSDAWDGMLARMGNQLTQFKDKELASTLTTTNRFLRFLDTLAVLKSTKASTFDPRELIGEKFTIYLVLPPEHIRTQSPLLRMWIGSLLRAAVRGGPNRRNFIHFVLDEAASLGHMEALDDAVDKYRSYCVRLQFYFQSLGQLKKCFPDGQDQTLLSNVSQVFFGVNDLSTAEYVSNRLGESTIILQSGGTGSGTSRQDSSRGEGGYSSSSNVNDNWGQHGRKLLKPEEVLALSERVAITFTPKVPPVWTTLVRYYEEPMLSRSPGKWKRFKALMEVMFMSVALLVSALMVAVVCFDAIRDRQPTSPPPASFQQQNPDYRTGDELWRETSSR